MDTATGRVTFWPAALASVTTSGYPQGEPGELSERLSPDARHEDWRERGVFPAEEVRSKKRRVTSSESELETEATMDPEAYGDFVRRMQDNGIDRDTGAWKLLFDEEAVARLKERNPSEWMRLMRGRRMESEGRQPAEDSEETGAEEFASRGGIGHVEEDEGRAVRVPVTPYVPTEKERREHNVTHYPHRTWCDTCMRGRGIAGKHVSSRDESDPNAGEFHFD